MKPVNFRAFFLPLNAVITGVVFFLLSPTTRIYASWFPDKKTGLWIFPLLVVSASAALWLLGSLSTPFLIRTGIFEERRGKLRGTDAERRVRMFKIILPVMSFIFHMLLLIGLCLSVIVWRQHHSPEEAPEGVSWNYVPR